MITRIETIKRQRGKWARQVVADLRDGHIEKAFNTLNYKGCLHFGEGQESAKKMLVEDWYSFQKTHPNKKSLVSAQKWSDVQELSKLICDIHISEG